MQLKEQTNKHKNQTTLSQKKKKAKKAKEAPTPAAGRSGAAPAPPGSARCTGRALRGPERGGCGNKAAVTAARQQPSCGESRPLREPTAAVATSGGGDGKASWRRPWRCHGDGPRPRGWGTAGALLRDRWSGGKVGRGLRGARMRAAGRARRPSGPAEHRADAGAMPSLTPELRRAPFLLRSRGAGQHPAEPLPPSAQVQLKTPQLLPKKGFSATLSVPKRDSEEQRARRATEGTPRARCAEDAVQCIRISAALSTAAAPGRGRQVNSFPRAPHGPCGNSLLLRPGHSCPPPWLVNAHRNGVKPETRLPG